MLDQLQHLFEGVAWTTVAISVVGGGAVVFLAYEHGWPWVKAKFQAIWGKTSAAISQLEDLVHLKVEDVHVRVDELDARLLLVEHAVFGPKLDAPAPTEPAPAEVMKVVA